MKYPGLFILIILIQFNVFSQEKYFTNIFFVDSNYGWVTTSYDTLLRTTNGGLVWEEIPFINKGDFTNIFFIDKNLGYISMDSSLYKTENGGLDWTPIFSGEVSSIFFSNNITGFIGGYPSLLKTIDGGATWTGVLDALSSIRKIGLINEDIGFATDFYDVYKTTDGGDNWEYYFYLIRGPDGLLDIFFLDELTWYKSEYRSNIIADGYFCSSINKGEDWDCHLLSPSHYIRNVYFSSADVGWCILDTSQGYYTLQYTTDRGQSWQLNDLPLKNFYFINGEIAWGYTKDGNIYHTNDGWLTSMLQYSIVTSVIEEDESLNEFALSQNYPNPFNPLTSIEYRVASREYVILKVYDVLGREVATLVNEEKQPGVYEVEFDGSTLSSGTYFYRLLAGEFVEVKKLILLK